MKFILEIPDDVVYSTCDTAKEFIEAVKEALEFDLCINSRVSKMEVSK